MNYDHTYHAGNFADVLKHIVLCLCLESLREKDKPFFVLDTHGGQGRFDLASPHAEKTGEAEAGIVRLVQAAKSEPMPESIQSYLRIVKELGWAGDRLRAYPGSPLLSRRLMRPTDRLIVCEKHPVFVRSLKALLKTEPNTRIEAGDGYAFMKSLLPPAERRGLVLIDPPFEVPDEFVVLGRALRQALKRWATGRYLVWFPIKDVEGFNQFRETLLEWLQQPALIARLSLAATGKITGLVETGILAINPPYQLEKSAPEIMGALAKTLGHDGTNWTLELLNQKPEA